MNSFSTLAITCCCHPLPLSDVPSLVSPFAADAVNELEVSVFKGVVMNALTLPLAIPLKVVQFLLITVYKGLSILEPEAGEDFIREHTERSLSVSIQKQNSVFL